MPDFRGVVNQLVFFCSFLALRVQKTDKNNCDNSFSCLWGRFKASLSDSLKTKDLYTLGMLLHPSHESLTGVLLWFSRSLFNFSSAHDSNFYGSNLEISF